MRMTERYSRISSRFERPESVRESKIPVTRSMDASISDFRFSAMAADKRNRCSRYLDRSEVVREHVLGFQNALNYLVVLSSNEIVPKSIYILIISDLCRIVLVVSRATASYFVFYVVEVEFKGKVAAV